MGFNSGDILSKQYVEKWVPFGYAHWTSCSVTQHTDLKQNVFL